MDKQVQSLVPFLKWAGGKRWLIRKHREQFAIGDGGRYVEPFVGSGAVFFELNPRRAILNDINVDLIETYRAIRDNWRGVVRQLGIHQKLHSVEHYYHVRDMHAKSQSGRAAKFIYLNRTCFNGLYRVNRIGKFNVPIGTKSSVVLESDDFQQLASVLRRTKLLSGDFESVIDECGSDDLIYADPPYTVKHNLNGFNKYNERLFSWADQERLKRALVRAVGRGATVLVSNADHKSVRTLYADAELIRAERFSVMASDANRRRKTSELLISMGTKRARAAE